MNRPSWRRIGYLGLPILILLLVAGQCNLPAAQLSIGDVTLAEGDSGTTAFTFTVTLDIAVTGGVSVDYATSAGTATADVDYVSTSGTLTFVGTAGETQPITVNVNGDTDVEPDETFTVTLSSPTATNVTFGDNEGVGTITDDDAATLTIGDVTLAEGDSGTTVFTFTVTLDNAVTGGASVDYATSDVTATAGDDYTSANGTLTFVGTAGETQTITVNVNGDTDFEPDEIFKVTLSNLITTANNVTIGDAEGLGTITNDDANPDQPVIDEIMKVLPDMGPFELVQIDDDPIVADLAAAAAILSPDPVRAELPVLDESGNMVMQNWIAYHVDVREIITDLKDSEEVMGVDPDLFSGPSMTFRGIPNWSDEEFSDEFAKLVEAQTIDENVLQPSVLNLIGGRLEGAYFTGGPGSPSSASVIDNIENLLELHIGADEAKRLAGMTSNNYIVYRQENFQPDVEHGEIEFPEAQTAPDATDGITPQLHTNTRTLRPVMVADLSIYDPTPGTWLINNWFARVDSAANRQNAYLWLANIAPDIASGSTLATDNNRILVRTKIAGYRVLTAFGESLYTTPAQSCNGSPNFVDEMRKLSHNFLSFQNEYWMWWTRNYGGGCAYINTLGRTPRNGAVGWSGFGSGTVDWTSFVFMHESGHIIGGTHSTNTASSPETLSSHRCKLFGFWPIGPTGPSLMSYASGTRTYCFAATPASGAPKKNLTKVAEYLHSNIQ